MNMNCAGLAGPGVGRNDERHHDRCQPLADHQLSEQLIGVDVNLLLLFLEQLFSAPGQFFFYRKHSVAFPCSPRFLSAQPKTDVCARTLVRLSIKETIALSPVLSPEWPREAVIPPLKSKRPLGSKRNVWPDVSAPKRCASAPST